MVRFVSREPVRKGWSADRKYLVRDEAGSRYLLRVSDASLLERRTRQFEMCRRAFESGVPMPEPVEAGLSEEGAYTLERWIDGEDAETAVPRLPRERQYALGLEAGRALRRIHALPAPADVPEWEKRFNEKLDRKLRIYAECPLKYEGGAAFIRCIEAGRPLLAGRQQCYQHGDYHIGNMMIDRNGRLCVIDFDRDDFGDPWEEFNRIVWSAQASPPFAAGTVDGYFGGDPPEAFWPLLALYISGNALGSLPWAIDFGEREIAVMRAQAAEILRWYDGMKNAVPSWYREGTMRTCECG